MAAGGGVDSSPLVIPSPAVRPSDDSAGSSAGPAWASRREREDGPAVGDDETRLRGNRRDVGGRVALNDSSTSGSGGPAGMGMASEAGRTWADGSDCGSAEGNFFDGSRRLCGNDGCVQSSTSSM